jgi:hypothetical protein
MVEPLLVAGAAVGSLVVGVVGGYALGHRQVDTGPTNPGTPPEIASIADRLDCRPEQAAVERALDDITGAIQAVIDSHGFRDRTALSANTGAVERANAVRTAVENGELCPGATEAQATESSEGGQEGTIDASDTESTPRMLADSVAAVRTEYPTRTQSGDRLLTYLESAGDTPEPQFRDTLSTVIEQLNRHHAVAEALGDVPRSADAAELARTLDRTSADLDGPESDGLDTIATRLSETARAKTECETERARLAEEVGQLCDTVDAHTGVAIAEETDPVERLQSITNRIDEGTVTVGESRSSLQRIAGQLGLSPESRLGRDFVDVVTSQRVDREAFERILPEVVSAIERAETTSHRLEGVDADTVAQQADRLVDEFTALDTEASAALEERAADLRSMVADAGDSDPVTVYGARQELRFYDRTLLPELKNPDTAGPEREELDTLETEVETRRSRIRTEYPSEYPEHNHNIPIHFLELVSTLQDLAADARSSGHDQRALGYLRAAEEALDWIQELYERHAYSVLLEQLRD